LLLFALSGTLKINQENEADIVVDKFKTIGNAYLLIELDILNPI